MSPSGCAQCGRAGTVKWTINRQGEVGVIDLCAEHSEPLEAIYKMASSKPPRARNYRSTKPPQRVNRKARYDVLDWTPPAA